MSPDAVLTSPLLRARETGQELARPAGLEAEPDERLAPGATAEAVRAAAEERGETVVVVGHQPDCSQIAAALTGGPEPAFPPGAMLAIELPNERDRRPRPAQDRTARSRRCAGSTSRSQRGEVFGLLGPNGAGKTTTVEILEGYRKRDGGEVEVLGVDPATRRRRLARADRRRPPVLGDVRDAHGRGDAARLRRLLRAAAAARRGGRARRPAGEARRPRAPALRRPAPPPRPRPGARSATPS